MAEIPTAPVQPLRFWTAELSFKTHEASPPIPNVHRVPRCLIGTDGRMLTQPNGREAFHARVSVDVTDDIQEQPLPYEAHIVVVALFGPTDDYHADQQAARKLLVHNGLALTYGYARDTLAHATADAPFGPFLLPAVYLQDKAEELLAGLQPVAGVASAQQPAEPPASPRAGRKKAEPSASRARQPRQRS